jgi:hypothetical protein
MQIYFFSLSNSSLPFLLYTLAKKGALDFYVIKCTSYLPKQGQWFYPGTPASSTTKTGRHDIAEKLLQRHKTPFKQKRNPNIKWSMKISGAYFKNFATSSITFVSVHLCEVVIQSVKEM